jgi:hypothetical protein
VLPAGAAQAAPTGNWIDPGNYDASGFDGGDGSQGDPFLISTAAQLARAADLTNNRSRNTLCYKLTADIDLGAHYWTPIGWEPPAGPILSGSGYWGIFDGDGHTISNLTIDNHSGNAGLFGEIFHSSAFPTEHAIVRNVHLVNVDIKTGDVVGGIAGKNSGGTVENCSVTGSVAATPDGDAGGLVGNNQGTVRNCTSGVDVSSTGQGRAGALAGYNGDTISGCTVYDTVKVNGAPVNASNLVGDGTVSDLNTAPTIKGPTAMTLTEGYAAVSTGNFTVNVTALVTVTIINGKNAVTWDAASKKLDIAPGLTAGTYTVELKAGSGTPPDATHTFTLTVIPASSPPYQDPVPSSDASPTSISVTLNGTTYKVERQTDGTYLFTLPAGTDITALKVKFTLPYGATMTPTNESAQDFSKGPVSYIITAEDGTTKIIVKLAARVEVPSPLERPYFSTLPSDCRVGYVKNADDTVTAALRIPFLAGADPAKIAAIRAAFGGVTVSNVSYSYVDADGKATPIAARTSTNPAAPYLQITFTAPSLEALAKGALNKIEYWLKDDRLEYLQTYTGGLKLSDVEFKDETPPPEPPEPVDPEPVGPVDPEPTEKGGGGCDAGAGAVGMAVLPALFHTLQKFLIFFGRH